MINKKAQWAWSLILSDGSRPKKRWASYNEMGAFANKHYGINKWTGEYYKFP